MSFQNTYISPSVKYSSLDTYNSASTLVDLGQKNVPSNLFPILPNVESKLEMDTLTHGTSDNYPVVDKAYGSKCNQSYYVAKCPSNQFVRDFSKPAVATTPKPKQVPPRKMNIKFVDILVREGYDGTGLYEVVQSSLPGHIKSKLQMATKYKIPDTLYIGKPPGSNDYEFYHAKNKKMVKIPMDKPQIKLTTTPSKVVNGENVIGTAQYHYPTATPPGMPARPGMSPPPGTGMPPPLPGTPSGMPPPPMESTENYTAPTLPPVMTVPRPGMSKYERFVPVSVSPMPDPTPYIP